MFFSFSEKISDDSGKIGHHNKERNFLSVWLLQYLPWKTENLEP